MENIARLWERDKYCHTSAKWSGTWEMACWGWQWHPCCVHCSVHTSSQCDIWLWILLYTNTTCPGLVKVLSFSSINVLSWLKLGLCKENKDSAIVSDQESCKQTSWTNKWQAAFSLQAQITTVLPVGSWKELSNFRNSQSQLKSNKHIRELWIFLKLLDFFRNGNSWSK